MLLSRGKRFILTNQSEFIKVQQGAVEVYIAGREGASRGQMFLTESSAGDAVFPSFDEFDATDIMVYALQDTELLILNRDSYVGENNRAELLNLMRAWFLNLSKTPFFALFAAKGDTSIINWTLKNGIFSEDDSVDTLWKKFKDNQSIVSMLSGVKFQSADLHFSQRLKDNERLNEHLENKAAANLLNEPSMVYEEGYSHKETVREAVFVVSAIANALSLSAENTYIGELQNMDSHSILRRLMQNMGIAFHAVTLEQDWEKSDSGAIIAYFGEKKELAALIPQTPETYNIITLKNPTPSPVTEEIVKKIHSNAFVCYAGFPSEKLSVKELLRFMMKTCWKADYRTIIVASFFASLIPLLTPIVTETIFSDIIPINDHEGLTTVTQVMMVTGFGSAALALMRSIATLRINMKVNIAADIALWHRLLKLPAKFFRNFQAGELLSRMNALSSIKELITGEYIGGIFSVVFSVWSLLLMLWYSIKLTIAACFITFAYLLVVTFIYRRVFKYERNLIEAGNKSAGQVQEIFSGLPKFRAHGGETEAFYLWSKFFGEEWYWTQKLRWQGNKYAVLSALQPFVLNMALYYLVMFHLNETVNGTPQITIEYPAFLAFSAACATFSSSLVSAIPLVIKVFSLRPHIDNLRPILDAKPEDAEHKPDIDKLFGAVEVRHLSFAYTSGNNVLKDISFTINAGESVAIVGPSGCGKSTLIRLLLGFETPKNGAIFYDGQDMSEVSITSLRSLMGVVLQNGQLMTGDILSNITGVSNLTMEDAWKAAESAGIAEDIRNMPMQMMTMISEGSGNISGGQKQRILIARAIINRPAVLIFDEATSALDNESQAIVTESLNKLKSTRIIVAHRLSTIKDVDKILVLSDGKIVESGKYDELMRKGGFFSNLVKRQVL